MRPWQEALQQSVRTVADLRRFVALEAHEAILLEEAIRDFPLQIPLYYLNLIDPQDPHDPIKELVVPSVLELNRSGWLDTSGEHDNVQISGVQGVQHKYTSTALLLMNTMCAGYCRYCFRKRLMNRNEPDDERLRDYEAAAGYIRRHPEINNVLLSGGDPLILSNEKLDRILGLLRQIDSVKIIRIGSKVPAFLPSRITTDPELLEVFARHTSPEKRLYVISHFDHPRELTPQALEGIELLLRSGVVVANQTALLHGINDTPVVLRELFNRLSYSGATPYYLFQCRPVQGSRHSQVPLVNGYAIFEAAKQGMAGLAKRARYIMSHYTGKIEIMAIDRQPDLDTIYLKYHQARQPEDTGRFFALPLPPDACWLDELILQEELSDSGVTIGVS